jgi:hypothetical protein
MVDDYNNDQNQDNFQLTPVIQEKQSPQETVSEIIAYIKAGITLTFYLMLVTIVLGIGYIVLRVTLWAASTVVKALGL